MKRFRIAAVLFVVFVVLGLLWKARIVQTEVNNSVEKKMDVSVVASTHLATPREKVGDTVKRAVRPS